MSIRNTRPSRCVMVFVKPVSASVSDNSISITKSEPSNSDNNSNSNNSYDSSYNNNSNNSKNFL